MEMQKYECTLKYLMFLEYYYLCYVKNKSKEPYMLYYSGMLDDPPKV